MSNNSYNQNSFDHPGSSSGSGSERGTGSELFAGGQRGGRSGIEKYWANPASPRRDDYSPYRMSAPPDRRGNVSGWKKSESDPEREREIEDIATHHYFIQHLSEVYETLEDDVFDRIAKSLRCGIRRGDRFSALMLAKCMDQNIRERAEMQSIPGVPKGHDVIQALGEDEEEARRGRYGETAYAEYNGWIPMRGEENDENNESAHVLLNSKAGFVSVYENRLRGKQRIR